jgi:hypothetical protein
MGPLFFFLWYWVSEHARGVAYSLSHAPSLFVLGIYSQCRVRA